MKVKYYELDDCKDRHHQLDIFKKVYQTKDLALDCCRKFLESVRKDPNVWFFTNLYMRDCARIDYEQRVEFRPKSRTINIVAEDSFVEMNAVVEFRVVKDVKSVSIVNIDGVEYSRTETIVEEVKPWEALFYDNLKRQFVYTYMIYINKRELEFDSDDDLEIEK